MILNHINVYMYVHTPYDNYNQTKFDIGTVEYTDCNSAEG